MKNLRSMNEADADEDAKIKIASASTSSSSKDFKGSSFFYSLRFTDHCTAGAAGPALARAYVHIFHPSKHLDTCQLTRIKRKRPFFTSLGLCFQNSVFYFVGRWPFGFFSSVSGTGAPYCESC